MNMKNHWVSSTVIVFSALPAKYQVIAYTANHVVPV